MVHPRRQSRCVTEWTKKCSKFWFETQNITTNFSGLPIRFHFEFLIKSLRFFFFFISLPPLIFPSPFLFVCLSPTNGRRHLSLKLPLYARIDSGIKSTYNLALYKRICFKWFAVYFIHCWSLRRCLTSLARSVSFTLSPVDMHDDSMFRDHSSRTWFPFFKRRSFSGYGCAVECAHTRTGIYTRVYTVIIWVNLNNLIIRSRKAFVLVCIQFEQEIKIYLRLLLFSIDNYRKNIIYECAVAMNYENVFFFFGI